MNKIPLDEVMNPKPWTVSRAEIGLAELLRGKPILTRDEAVTALYNQRAINLLKYREGSLSRIKRTSEEDLSNYFERKYSDGYKPRASFTEGLAKGVVLF